MTATIRKTPLGYHLCEHLPDHRACWAYGTLKEAIWWASHRGFSHIYYRDRTRKIRRQEHAPGRW